MSSHVCVHKHYLPFGGLARHQPGLVYVAFSVRHGPRETFWLSAERGEERMVWRWFFYLLSELRSAIDGTIRVSGDPTLNSCLTAEVKTRFTIAMLGRGPRGLSSKLVNPAVLNCMEVHRLASD